MTETPPRPLELTLEDVFGAVDGYLNLKNLEDLSSSDAMRRLAQEIFSLRAENAALKTESQRLRAYMAASSAYGRDHAPAGIVRLHGSPDILILRDPDGTTIEAVTLSTNGGNP